MNRLIGMHFSPWTERARWALDYHAIPYKFTEYTSMLGEPGLRLRARKPVGKVSVPLLITAQERIGDSFDIAVYADRQAGREPLVPAEHAAEIRQWADAAELALCSARIRATRRIQGSGAALAERLPAYIPDRLRKPLAPMAWLGAEFILRKYSIASDGDDALLANMTVFLERAARAIDGRPFIFERFSFADIVVATMLQAVTPVHGRYIDLGPASREVMCEPELQDRYAALLAWRDRTYAEQRRLPDGR